jgi:hypothetical protein
MTELVVHSMPIGRQVPDGPDDGGAAWTAAVRRARTKLDEAVAACRRDPLMVHGPYRLERAGDGTRWLTCTVRDHLYADERELRVRLPESSDTLLAELRVHGLTPSDAELETIANSYGRAGELLIANRRARRERDRAPQPQPMAIAGQIAALNARWRAEGSA